MSQRAASLIRQALAVLSTIAGVLTASVQQLHLPPSVSAILTAAGPLILAVEHYVSDPSTGTTNQKATAVVNIPPNPPAVMTVTPTGASQGITQPGQFVPSPLTPPLQQ